MLFQERGDDFGFGEGRGKTVGGENGAVVVAVRATQFGRHRRFVVKVGERTIRIAFPKKQNHKFSQINANFIKTQIKICVNL